MITTFADGEFKWIDVQSPNPDELHRLSEEYGIHEAFIADVLQPEHLPKYEPLGDISFFILRYYSADEKSKEDTIQGLTNKIAIFHHNNLVITIHRIEIAFIRELKINLIDSGKCNGVYHLLNRLVKSVLLTFEPPAGWISKSIDFYESQTFLNKQTPNLQAMYHLKRKIEMSKRLLKLSNDILEQIDDPAHEDPHTRDTRDLYVKLLTSYETMSDNVNNLLTLYFSISAQRTNEVMRILTIFSVFFMPLTFIVGIYGMNFDFMPELRIKFAYPAVIIFMVIVTIVIYTWFKRKGWL
jgi:magnesium transporter